MITCEPGNSKKWWSEEANKAVSFCCVEVIAFTKVFGLLPWAGLLNRRRISYGFVCVLYSSKLILLTVAIKDCEWEPKEWTKKVWGISCLLLIITGRQTVENYPFMWTLVRIDVLTLRADVMTPTFNSVHFLRFLILWKQANSWKFAFIKKFPLYSIPVLAPFMMKYIYTQWTHVNAHTQRYIQSPWCSTTMSTIWE